MAILPYEIGEDVTCGRCGGESCWCEGCMRIGKLLLDGERDCRVLGLKEEIKEWNSETGIKGLTRYGIVD